MTNMLLGNGDQTKTLRDSFARNIFPANPEVKGYDTFALSRKGTMPSTGGLGAVLACLFVVVG